MQRQDFKKTDDMFNRVLGKEHLAIVSLMEDKFTGTRFVIANAHIHWDPAYCDVKLVQVALLVDEIEKMASHFAKYPPRPPPLASTSSVVEAVEGEEPAETGAEPPSSTSSPSIAQHPQQYRTPPVYTDGTKIPLIICGDFNSVPSSGVYDFLSNGTLPADHADFKSHKYGRYTSEGLRHRFGLKSAYAAPGAGEPPVTNYVPTFQGHIDYLWYSAANLEVNAILGGVDKDYLEKVVGFPNAHFPSDHLCIVAEFRVKPPRENPPRPPAFS
jgi:CCR4-NOT transcription complex subunit 6